MYFTKMLLLNAYFSADAVAKIEEERQAEQKEREQMQINFEQHRQLELKQQEEKKKVRNYLNSCVYKNCCIMYLLKTSTCYNIILSLSLGQLSLPGSSHATGELSPDNKAT